MGYYIQTKRHLHKADQLLSAYPEVQEVASPQFDGTGQNIILCVVENGPFDAVGIAYSLAELREMRENMEGRPHRWLVMPRALVLRLCPAVQEALVPLPSEILAFQQNHPQAQKA